VREGKLTPVKEGAGAAKRSITYHDPCYIARHNGVYSPPRELLQVLPGAELVEMERNSERSFCCGAGGARMWMEETIGERINVNRTNEAVGTGADQIAVGCPFCRVMLSDGLTAAQADGTAREEVEVLDVAQMLLASVKGEQATKLAPGQAAASSSGGGTATATKVATKAEPEAGDVTQTEDTVTETSEVGPAAKASGGGSSLFDTPAPAEEKAPEPAAKAEPAKPAEKKESGGSLFDLGEPEAPAEPAPKAEKAEPAPAKTEAKPAADLGGGSLFDITPPAAEEPAAKAEAEAVAEADASKSEPMPTPAETKADDGDKPESGVEDAPVPGTETKAQAEIPSGGSLFDIAAPEPAAQPAAPAPKAEESKADEPEPQAEAEAEESKPDESDDAPTGGAAVSAAATAAASSAEAEAKVEAPAEPEPEPEAEAEPAESTEESEPEAPAAEEKPKPASSGTAHQPKTDVDINESGSLFDL
jgi:hypothetical protein